MHKLTLSMLTVWATLNGLTSFANAELISLAGPAFSFSDEPVEITAGVVSNTSARALLPFRTAGRVCRLSVVFLDNSPDADLTAKLLRKKINVGGDVFVEPVTMATITSSGASTVMQRLTTTAISQKVVNTFNSFYYLEVGGLYLPANGSDRVGLIGAQIDFRTDRFCS